MRLFLVFISDEDIPLVKTTKFWMQHKESEITQPSILIEVAN